MNWRFASRPRWLLGHVIIVGLVVLFAFLATWQFQRMNERADLNERTRAELDKPSQALTNITDVNALPEFRRVTLTGRWDHSRPIYVRYPVQDGVTGYNELLPFVLEDGAYVVATAFVPRTEGDEQSLPDVGFSDPVTIEAIVREGEKTNKPVAENNGEISIPTVGAVDLGRITPLWEPYPVASKWLQLTGPESAGFGDRPMVAMPDLSGGPHQGYMLQWIAFAILAVVGWSAVLWRTAKDRSSEFLDAPDVDATESADTNV